LNDSFSIRSLGDLNDYVIAFDDSGYLVGVTPSNLKEVWLHDDNEKLVAKVEVTSGNFSWYIVNLKSNFKSDCVRGPFNRSEISMKISGFDEKVSPKWER